MSTLSPLLSMNLSIKDGKPAKVTELANPTSLRLEDLAPFDESLNSDEGIELDSVTSLSQRLDQPEFQARDHYSQEWTFCFIDLS